VKKTLQVARRDLLLSAENGGPLIVKRYGSTVASVAPIFQSRALTEISFRRDHAFSISFEDFHAQYVRVEARDLTADAEGDVQDEVEAAVLRALEDNLRRIDQSLAPGDALLIESEAGVDYPKTREKRTNVIVEGENRLRFFRWIDPPLRVGVYKRRG